VSDFEPFFPLSLSRFPFLCLLRNQWRERRLAREMVRGDCAGVFKRRPLSSVSKSE
jgi:hypothetical protein